MTTTDSAIYIVPLEDIQQSIDMGVGLTAFFCGLFVAFLIFYFLKK